MKTDMDYKELIERLRRTNFLQSQRSEAADAIETLLAERDAEKRRGGKVMLKFCLEGNGLTTVNGYLDGMNIFELSLKP